VEVDSPSMIFSERLRGDSSNSRASSSGVEVTTPTSMEKLRIRSKVGDSSNRRNSSVGWRKIC
jgi:hypothetical protein